MGIHAVRLLAARGIRASRPNVLAVEIGVHVLDALHLLEWADHILAIDAMRCGWLPGTIYVTSPCEIESGPPRGSLHHVNLLGVFQLMPGCPAPEVTIIGVEPQTIDYGTELSQPVCQVLPSVVDLVERLAESLATRKLADRTLFTVASDSTV